MGIVEAIKELRNGKRVCRTGWKYKAIFLQEIWRADGERFLMIENKCTFVRVPYMVTSDDILALDWEVVELKEQS